MTEEDVGKAGFIGMNIAVNGYIVVIGFKYTTSSIQTTAIY